MFDLTVNPADDCNRLGSGRLSRARGRSGRSASQSTQTRSGAASSRRTAQQVQVQRVDVHRRVAARAPRVTSDDPRADLYLEMADLHNAPIDADLLGQRIDVWA